MNKKEEAKKQLIEYINKAKTGDDLRVVFFEMMRLNLSSDDINTILTHCQLKDKEIDEIIKEDNKSKGRH